MPLPPTLSVYAVVPDGAKAQLTSVGDDAVTVHPTGVLSQPSLHFSSLEQLEDWYHRLGQTMVGLRLERTNARRALDEMDRTLRSVGARR